MRKLLRVGGYALLSIFTADLLVSLADWSARVDWLKSKLDTHPHLAGFVRSPFFIGLMLLLGFGFLWAERKIKLPRISARFMNCKLVPRLGTVTIKALFDAQTEKPGWDQHTADWDWFVEVLLTNESETPTTIEGVDARLSKIRKILGIRIPSWLPWRKIFPCGHLLDFSHHCMHRSVQDIYDNSDSEIPSLMTKIKDVPLTIGIGHRGWLRFESRRITQKDLKNSELEIWLVDALQERHYVNFKKKDETKWDKSYSIVESSRQAGN